MMDYRNLDDVRNQLLAAGLVLESVTKANGGVDVGGIYVESVRSVRCDVSGEKKKKTGSYWLHELRLNDGIWITGAYWLDHGNSKGVIELRKTCAKCGGDMPLKATACPAAGCGSKRTKAREIPPEQIEAHKKRLAEARRQAEAEAARDAEKAAGWANAVWVRCREIFSPDEHEYLTRKKLKSAHGTRVFESNDGIILDGAEKADYEYLAQFHGALVVPMCDAAGRRRGLQFILSRDKHKALIAKRERDKEYWPGGMLNPGLHCLIGGAMRGVGLVAEGFATAASLAEASNLPVAVAFDANHLAPVAESLWKAAKKRLNLLIAADDDWLQRCTVCRKVTPVADDNCCHCNNPHGKQNAGVRCAQGAARIVSGAWFKPAFSVARPSDKKGPTDFNDLRGIEGPDAVRAQVEEKLADLGWQTPPGKPASAEQGNPASAVTGFDSDGRPIIRHLPGYLPEVLDAIGAALAAAPSINLFVRGDRLVRLYEVESKPDGAIQRPHGTLILHAVDPTHLAELATSAATHQKLDSRQGDFKQIDCPRRAAESYFARGHKPELNELLAFTEAPIVTADGRYIGTPGYDKDSGLFLALADSLAGIQAPDPTRISAERGMDALLEAVKTFPFVDWCDRSAALAGFITALLAPILPARPWFVVDATCPGTGKTLLVDGFAIVATGRTASILSLGNDDAETEKRIAGALFAGDRVINVDNIERPFGGDVVCQAATQAILRLRMLGSQNMHSVPTNSFLSATANQIVVRGDAKRRVCRINLDAKQERPEHRKFERNHLEYVAGNRAELIRAALAIPLAYFASGQPDVDIHPAGGFDLWDRMVRRPLKWLHLPDPLSSSDDLREADPEIEAMRQFMTECRTEYGESTFTAAEVLADALESEREVNGKSTGRPVRPGLRDAVRVVCRDKPSSTALGYWLRAHRERIVDGSRIEHAGEHGKSKVAKWRVISTAQTAGDRGDGG